MPPEDIKTLTSNRMLVFNFARWLLIKIMFEKRDKKMFFLREAAPSKVASQETFGDGEFPGL